VHLRGDRDSASRQGSLAYLLLASLDQVLLTFLAFLIFLDLLDIGSARLCNL